MGVDDGDYDNSVQRPDGYAEMMSERGAACDAYGKGKSDKQLKTQIERLLDEVAKAQTVLRRRGWTVECGTSYADGRENTAQQGAYFHSFHAKKAVHL